MSLINFTCRVSKLAVNGYSNDIYPHVASYTLDRCINKCIYRQYLCIDVLELLEIAFLCTSWLFVGPSNSSCIDQHRKMQNKCELPYAPMIASFQSTILPFHSDLSSLISLQAFCISPCYWIGQHQWSPEKAKSEGHGFPSDVWAVNCTFIHMLSGDPPWKKRFAEIKYLHYKVWTLKSHASFLFVWLKTVFCISYYNLYVCIVIQVYVARQSCSIQVTDVFSSSTSTSDGWWNHVWFEDCFVSHIGYGSNIFSHHA